VKRHNDLSGSAGAAMPNSRSPHRTAVLATFARQSRNDV
jgi:hypothetical protein